MLLKTTLARTTLLTVVLLMASTVRAEEQAVLLHAAPSKAEASKALRLEGTLVDDTKKVVDLVIRYRGPGSGPDTWPVDQGSGSGSGSGALPGHIVVTMGQIRL